MIHFIFGCFTFSSLRNRTLQVARGSGPAEAGSFLRLAGRKYEKHKPVSPTLFPTPVWLAVAAAGGNLLLVCPVGQHGPDLFAA